MSCSNQCLRQYFLWLWMWLSPCFGFVYSLEVWMCLTCVSVPHPCDLSVWLWSCVSFVVSVDLLTRLCCISVLFTFMIFEYDCHYLSVSFIPLICECVSSVQFWFLNLVSSWFLMVVFDVSVLFCSSPCLLMVDFIFQFCFAHPLNFLWWWLSCFSFVHRGRAVSRQRRHWWSITGDIHILFCHSSARTSLPLPAGSRKGNCQVDVLWWTLKKFF